MRNNGIRRERLGLLLTLSIDQVRLKPPLNNRGLDLAPRPELTAREGHTMQSSTPANGDVASNW